MSKSGNIVKLTEELIDFYNEKIKDKVNLNLKGIHPYKDIVHLTDKEIAIATSNGFQQISGFFYSKDYKFARQQNHEVVDKRKEILLGYLYDRIQDLISNNKEGLEKIIQTVRDPLSDSAMDFIKVDQGSITTTKSELISRVDDISNQANYLKLTGYLRAIVLLDTLNEDPSLIDQLKINSCYFPHRLVIDKMEESDIKIPEINEDIAFALFDLLDQDFVEKMKEIDKYIIDEKNYSVKLGPFTIPKNKATKDLGWNYIPIDLKKKYPTLKELGRRDDLDTMVNEVKEKFCDESFEERVYKTIIECWNIISDTILEVYTLNKKKPYGDEEFKFRLLGGYKNIIKAAIAYASNQIVSVWQEEGKIIETHSSKSLHMSSRMKGGKLQITVKNKVLGYPTYEFEKGLDYSGTHKSYLPFVVKSLYNLYKNADAIVGKPK